MISGAPAGYDGTWVVATARPNTYTFNVTLSGLAPGSGGTATSLMIQVVPTTTTDFVVGEEVTVSGASNGSYNGTYRISSQTHTVLGIGTGGFYLAGSVADLPASGAGTLGAAAVVSATVRCLEIETGGGVT